MRPAPPGRAVAAPAAVLAALLAAFLLPAARGEAALGGRWLERGDRGEDVRDLQRALRRLGYEIGVDGQFGPGTERVVRRYERTERIAIDGEVSEGQGKGMVRRVAQRSGGRDGDGDESPRRAEQTAFGTRTLERGDRGPGIVRLQDVLSALGHRVGVDGIFGPATQSSVRDYEREEDIRIDGKVSAGQARGMERRLEQRGPVAEPPVQPAPAPADDASRWFPIAGPWSWGGEGSGFGDRDGAHKGVDVMAACGTALVAPESGTVVFKASHERAGHYLVIRGAQSGVDHVYMHLQAPAPVERGQTVRVRQPIGAVGDTGNARGCHLHFEMWSAPGWYEGGAAFDPRPSLERWAQAARAAQARG